MADDLLLMLRCNWERSFIKMKQTNFIPTSKQSNMKKTILFFSLLTILATSFNSCKKQGEEDEECDVTMAAVAGKYKLISSKYVNGTVETNAINDLYEACELDDINELKADGTFIYSDLGTVCSPSGTESGTWSISGMTLMLNAGFSVIESFNCKNLVVSFTFGGQTVRETYQKQ